MATIGNNNLTLADQAKRLDPNGQVASIAEMLAEEFGVLNDIPVIEGNLETGHRHTIRTGLPTVGYRQINDGIDPSKSRTAQMDETAALLEGFSEVDKELLRLGGNEKAIRFTEDTAFLEAMRQQFADTLFYGDVALTPGKHTGLAPRYNSLSAANGENILDAGGTGSDNMSIWLVNWAPNKIFGFFPKGTSAGLEFHDHGTQINTLSNGKKLAVMNSQYIWRFGLAVKDWQYGVRIANIDVSDLTKDASAGADLIDLMVQGLVQIKSLEGGNPVWMVNRTAESFIRRQEKNDSNVRLTMDGAAGRPTLSFGEVPVRRVDALTLTEAQIT